MMLMMVHKILSSTLLDIPERSESMLSSAMKQPLLTCICSSAEEMSGYVGTGNPSADMSHLPG